ncbi:MAG: OadG family protein [Lachnospiraceae bacterium]|nr:OadG family protein [Lachnospiraceae bacterium]
MGMMVLAVDLTRALLNVAMGMIVVFVVLVLISFIISLFKYISIAQNKLEARKANKASIASSTDNIISQIEKKEEVVETYVEEAAMDDLELVAVITAAIAASMGTSTDGFVVRSIRRSSRSKWKNA